MYFNFCYFLGKLRKILPAECIENKASLCSLIRSLSDDDRDQKLEKEQDTDNEYNLTSCLIRAVEVRRPLFDQKISLSKRSEEIKNRLWNEIYVELQGKTFTYYTLLILDNLVTLCSYLP